MTDVDDLIRAARESGDGAALESRCRDGLVDHPDDEAIKVQLALALGWQGKQDEALAVYAELVHSHPSEATHWQNYAVALRIAGDLEGAADAYAHAVKLNPDDPDLLELYGLVQMDLGQRLEARDTLMYAFGKAPESAPIRIHAALACTACRDMRADNLLRPWRTWLPLDDFLESELAEALAQQGDVSAAIEVFEDLHTRLPGQRRLRLRLAGLYERTNRLDEAAALLDQVTAEGLADDPHSADAIEIQHQRARLAARQRDSATAQTILEAAGPLNERDADYWFTLAKTRDALGDAEGTMAALQHAHALQREELQTTHPHWFEAGVESPLLQKERVSKEEYSQWPALKAPDAAHSPVFVVGFPRSGTTLLEQMLDAHPRLQSMDERPFLNTLSKQLLSVGVKVPGDLARLDQRDCDELRKGYVTLACSKVPRDWQARLVDKNPLNMLWLPMIHRMFPEAQFILALRHPCDVLISNYMQNFMATSLSAVCIDLETLARAYVEAMHNWLHHVDVFKPNVFVSRYEDLVADPARQTRRIAEFLSLGDADAMLGYAEHARAKEFIATPSYTQVIEPVNRKALGRWQRYRKWLEPALPILAPMLEHWNYPTDAAMPPAPAR